MANVSDFTEPKGDHNITNTSWSDYLQYDYYFDLPIGYAYTLYIIGEIFPLILTLVAVFGNIMIIVTFMMKKNRVFSTASFFISLAASDLIAIVSSTFISWVALYISSWNMDVDCKVSPVFVQAPAYISSHTLAIITVERAISVCFPHKVRLICSPRIAKSLLIAIWIINFLFYILVSVNFGPKRDQGFVYCGLITESLELIFMYYYPWVNLALDFIIPFFVILIGSLIIIYKLYVRSQKNEAARITHLRAVSFTLITTNVVFILTKLPWTMFSLYVITLISQDRYTTDIETEYFLNTLFIFISDLNHAANFFIYILTGSQFRNDVKTLMTRLLRKVGLR